MVRVVENEDINLARYGNYMLFIRSIISNIDLWFNLLPIEADLEVISSENEFPLGHLVRGPILRVLRLKLDHRQPSMKILAQVITAAMSTVLRMANALKQNGSK